MTGERGIIGPGKSGQDDGCRLNYGLQTVSEIKAKGVPSCDSLTLALKTQCGLMDNPFPEGTPSPQDLLIQAFGDNSSLVLKAFQDQIALRIVSEEVIEDPDLEKARQAWYEYTNLLWGVCGEKEENRYCELQKFLQEVLGAPLFEKIVLDYQKSQAKK